MSRLTAFVACLSLLIGSAQASYLHIHLNPHSSHTKERHLGAAGTFHFHLNDHHHAPQASPEMTGAVHAHESDSVILDWIARHAQGFKKLAFLPVTACQPPAPTLVSTTYTCGEVMSHDPPGTTPFAPRSPPA